MPGSRGIIFASAKLKRVQTSRQETLKNILALIQEHGPVSGSEIDQLLLDKLPEVLSGAQKKHKVHNLLSELSRQKLILNVGSRARSRWRAANGVGG